MKTTQSRKRMFTRSMALGEGRDSWMCPLDRSEHPAHESSELIFNCTDNEI